jgi:hypothetical protein
MSVAIMSLARLGRVRFLRSYHAAGESARSGSAERLAPDFAPLYPGYAALAWRMQTSGECQAVCRNGTNRYKNQFMELGDES